jgi:LytS/YehU family sensor histidine kinase
MPEDQRSYLCELGVKTVLIIPLTSRGQVNGRLTFRFTEERDFNPEELEIARALATQASLAIQLTRLAKTARQSAVLERSNIPGSLRCNFSSRGVPEENLPPSARQELLRIAQEAISNAVRHAKPTVISVEVRWEPPNVVLEVTDNGSGIANPQLASRGGFGLSNMRPGLKNSVPNSIFELRPVAAPASSFSYRSIDE